MTDQSGSLLFASGVFPFTANGKNTDDYRAAYVQCFTSGVVQEALRDFPPFPRIIPRFRVK